MPAPQTNGSRARSQVQRVEGARQAEAAQKHADAQVALQPCTPVSKDNPVIKDAPPGPERGGNNVKCFKDSYLKAKARSWP